MFLFQLGDSTRLLSVTMDDPGDATLRGKEEYYRKLNESLKSKAASLIAQAESALKEQTEACDTFDIPLVRREREAKGGKGMNASEESGVAPLETLHEQYQVTLQQKVDTPVPNDGSDSDGSLIEPFENLDTNGEALSQSASSIASKNLSSAAQARLYQAKLRVARAERTNLKAQYDKLLKENIALNDRCKGSEKENQRVIVGAQKHATEISKLKQALEEAKNQVQNFKSECASWKKDAEDNLKEAQAAHKSNSQTEVKLKRVNEEVEKLKLALEAEKRRAKEVVDAMKEKVAFLEASNKNAEKQKQELIAGFKKQMKLIDVLKRQKLHLEGAKLLQISEEEFLKVVDLTLNE